MNVQHWTEHFDHYRVVGEEKQDGFKELTKENLSKDIRENAGKPIKVEAITRT